MQKNTIKTPKNIKELEECLKLADDYTYLISGCTDFMIRMRQYSIRYGRLIDLTGIDDIKYIKESASCIKIGAGTILTDIAENESVNKYIRALAQAAGKIGSTQIRNAATIAGNIANASPCADTITPLMAFNAKLKVLNGRGKIVERRIDEVVAGAGSNFLKKDEAIIEVSIPKYNENYLSAFSKLGSRTSVTISKLNAAALVKISNKNIIEDAYMFLGALAPKAFSCQLAEKVLLDKKPGMKVFKSFCEALTKQVDIAIPKRSSRYYKREAILGLAYDIFRKLFGEDILKGDME
ncbi:FAD binding domain-containing protein [Maledivibacter halophilus]|uniref:Carbon-monoxide dehydrogenase medium subunit n=1 Tax=Maledivibacter halophilus TaxID=36842 RepID=A0A1T5M9C5_9FIRM|nr:FAD binding domain-containing protein [Maledivibacter halophilus]SKC84842.1 carbon-monoxide dehydrogenase medium subunit [Maledivibacter halophilus]